MNERLYEINSVSYHGVGSRLALACEEYCKEIAIPYLGLDVNPTDNSAAKRLYERLGYHAVGEIHLDGVYEYTDEQVNHGAQAFHYPACEQHNPVVAWTDNRAGQQLQNEQYG